MSKGDYRPVIRPDIANKIREQAFKLGDIDPGVLINMYLEACVGTVQIEFRPNNTRIRVDESAQLILPPRMKKEVL